MIELRSDTFTLPIPEMLDAMVHAELGNDGYGEDPTVIRLEEMVAAVLRKESACLMPSGTMANICSVLAWHKKRGGHVLVGDQSDIYVYEDHTVAEWAGANYLPLPTQADGSLLLADIRVELQKITSGGPKAGLLCLEDPHNLCGGVVLGPEYLREVAALAHAHGTALHLDGARLFNASSRLKVSPAEIVQHVDSVQFCLSKGLAAPIGSVAVGDASFIAEVRAQRKMLGGNMRQAGIVAAAGIVALQQMTDRLEEDHLTARLLAEGLAQIPGIKVNLDTVQTNTVVFRVVDQRFDCESFIEALKEYGVHLSEFKYGRVRAVTHYGITTHDVTEALKTIARILSKDSSNPARQDYTKQSARKSPYSATAV